MQTDFDSFALGTALALRYLALRCIDAKDFKQAEALYREAADDYRGLAKNNPAQFEPELASCLESLGSIYLDLGSSEQARRSAEDAAEILTRLAAADPARFGDRLAMCLFIHSEAIEDTDPAKACALRDRAAHAAFSPALKQDLEARSQTCGESGLSARPN